MQATCAVADRQHSLPVRAGKGASHRAYTDTVMLDIGHDESLLAPLVRAFGAIWNETLWVWEMDFWTATELGLEPWML